MPRLILPVVLMTIVVLGAPPGVAAKEIRAMTVCGADRCAKVERATAQRWHETGGLEGPPLSPPSRRAPYYRVTTFIGEPGGGPAGHFSLAYIPRLDAVLPLASEPPAPWMRVSGSVAKQLAPLARGMTPLPAKQLDDAPAEVTGGALAPEVYTPPRAAEADALPRPLLAGLPAVLLLGLVFAFFALRRRRNA